MKTNNITKGLAKNFSIEEALPLLQSFPLNSSSKPFLLSHLCTGVRAQELLSLKWENISEAEIIHIR